MANKQTRHIIVETKVTGDGADKLKGLANSLTQLNRSTKSINTSLNNFGNTFKTMFVSTIFATAGKRLIDMSDSMQMLRDRIKTLTTDGTPVNEIIEKIGDSADRARIPLADMANIYARISLAANKTGLSTQSLVDITETLQKTFILSGSSAREAAAASIQLSQGLSAGVLRGEEFNSVMEQNGKLAQLLAEKILGPTGTAGALRAMAREGKLVNSQVLKAMALSAEEVDKAMDGMRYTVGQSVTIAFNKLSKVVDKLNEDFNISSGLAAGILFLTDNLRTLAVVVGGVVVISIIKMIRAIGGLQAALAAMNTVGRLNLVVLGLTAIAALGTLIYDNWTSTKALFMDLVVVFHEMRIGIAEFLDVFSDLGESTRKFFGTNDSFKKGNDAAMKGLREQLDAAKKLRDKYRKDAENENQKKGGINYKALIDDINNNLKQTEVGGKAKKAKEYLAELNNEFLRTKNATEYFNKLNTTKLEMLNAEFKLGKMDLEAYTNAQLELKKVDLNKQWKDGTVSLSEYNEELRKIEESSALLKLQAGSINMDEFRKTMVELGSSSMTFWDSMSVGMDNYIGKTKNWSQAIANVTTSAFKGVEDQFVSFVMKGKADWKDFGNAIMEELLRITYQLLIMKPLIDSFKTAFVSDAPAPTSATPNATGQAYSSSGIEMFASGGIVSSPSFFNFGRNQLGVAGEAGPEAILPLRRGSNGDLGVQATTAPVYININNTTGADVQTSESTGANGERMIEVTIINTVRKAMESGKLDTTMSRNFNVRRQGV